MNHRLLAFVSVMLFAASATPAFAGDCYADPVYQYQGTGTIKSAVFLRNEACMDGSKVISTVSSGATVQVLGFTDGWYYIGLNGGKGWIGAQFLNPSPDQSQGQAYGYSEFMAAYPSAAPGVAAPKPTVPVYTSDATLLGRVKGYILLQTESHGEAWYVHPTMGKRYYMKDGPTAYQMMRSFGLGVTEKDYAAMANGNTTMKSGLRGRILLRVQAHGEAYYIHPKTLTMHYLQNGEEAYRVMRLYSLGITNNDLGSLATAEIPVK